MVYFTFRKVISSKCFLQCTPKSKLSNSVLNQQHNRISEIISWLLSFFVPPLDFQWAPQGPPIKWILEAPHWEHRCVTQAQWLVGKRFQNQPICEPVSEALTSLTGGNFFLHSMDRDRRSVCMFSSSFFTASGLLVDILDGVLDIKTRGNLKTLRTVGVWSPATRHGGIWSTRRLPGKGKHGQTQLLRSGLHFAGWHRHMFPLSKPTAA